jgi:hypothetical protein
MKGAEFRNSVDLMLMVISMFFIYRTIQYLIALLYTKWSKVSVRLLIAVHKNTQKYFKQFQSRTMITCYLNTVFENTVRRVNKGLETGGGQFEHYVELSVL